MNFVSDIDFKCEHCGKTFKVPLKAAATAETIFVCPYCHLKDNISHNVIEEDTTNDLQSVADEPGKQSE